MPLTIQQGRAYFGIELPLVQFEQLARAHLSAVPSTPTVEDRGRSFVEHRFPEADVRAFVRAICDWGGYTGISGRILNRNTPAAICSALKQAVQRLDAHVPDLAAALANVNAIKGLGTPSFASKHLRFMRPALCPVFDSLLQETLPYSFDTQGYAMFAQDCKILAEALTRAGVPNPRERPWFVADVEAALYAYIKALRVNKGMDSDNYSAPLRATIIARHRER
jgi:hypothetical protein